VLSERLWESISDVYSAILSHPFITGLVSGKLEEERFKYYIIQDYHYLKDFSKALAVLSAKAESQEQSVLFATHVSDVIKVERDLHNYFFTHWKINPEDFEQSPSNLMYTSYLLSTVYSRPFYEGVAVVLPCYWIYMEVGRELTKKGSPNPLYKRWIDTYGGEEYEVGVKNVLNIINSFKLTDSQEKMMFKHFRLASIFEYMFWDMAYRLERFPFKIKV